MKKLGEYQIENVLGRGATAQVYKATKTGSTTAVALKVFHTDNWDESELRKRVMKEAKLASDLDHPNIVRLLAVHFDLNPPALAMEFIEGESLDSFRSKISDVLPEVGVLIALEILEGLKAAHAKKIVHRDLKPANILIEKLGRVCIADFGLAKVTNITQTTLTGTVLGSPDFMSPEQAEGDICNEKSDLFSLAAILYYLVTGAKPFSRSTPLLTLAAVAKVETEQAQHKNPKLGADLARIVHKGLSRDPNDRYSSAEDFANTLKAYLSSLNLDSEFFSLKNWIQAPSLVSAEALKRIANALTQRCAAQIETMNWDSAMEILAHLGQIAPESEAIPSLVTDIEERRAKERRKKALLLSTLGSVALIVLCVLGYYGVVQYQHYAAEKMALVEAERAKQAALAEQTRLAEEKSKELARKAALPTVALSGIQKPEKGSVVFKVPASVEIYWDGKLIDATQPLNNVTSGEHHLRMIRNGAKPISGMINVKAKQPTVIEVE